MDHPLKIAHLIASALLLFAAPLFCSGQSIGGLTARATSTAIVIRPTSLEGASLEDLQFSYSQNEGATWQQIDPSCIEYVAGEAIWHVLKCLQIDIFEGTSLQFKAVILDCQSIDYNGYVYDLVQIGGQCWFAENLRTEHYSNGTLIPTTSDFLQWRDFDSGASVVYFEDDSLYLDFGRLYNLYAIKNRRGLCPQGWSVPRGRQWGELFDFLNQDDRDNQNWTLPKSQVGLKLKATPSNWLEWDGLDLVGFTALPCGWLEYNFGFTDAGRVGCWWVDRSIVFNYLLSTNGSAVCFRSGSEGYFWEDQLSRSAGINVRCVRD